MQRDTIFCHFFYYLCFQLRITHYELRIENVLAAIHSHSATSTDRKPGVEVLGDTLDNTLRAAALQPIAHTAHLGADNRGCYNWTVWFELGVA